MTTTENELIITILYSTQSGRAKACARRSSRLLKTKYPSILICGNCSFDEFGAQNFLSLGSSNATNKNVLLLFVSTTGDGEHTTSIAKTWSALLSKSLPSTLFSNVPFALFALGDRAYGDAFCAAGRKLAARLVQLGASPMCVLGYGDDGSGAGVLGDLDGWLGESFFGVVDGLDVSTAISSKSSLEVAHDSQLYSVEIVESDHVSSTACQEWQKNVYSEKYADYFQYLCPNTAYQYNTNCVRLNNDETYNNSGITNEGSQHALTRRVPPLLGCVTVNNRITAEDWIQNTRHLRIRITKNTTSTVSSAEISSNATKCSLPYQAGDVATVLPSNPTDLVSRFLSILPASIRSISEETIHIRRIQPHLPSINHPWPELCTLRGLLTHCADIQSLPEQEDLLVLSQYCNLDHPNGNDQREKLISLSEQSGAALYADYIIRNKRNWVDLFYDFDSLFFDWQTGANNVPSKRTLFAVASLISLLPSIAPRHFSIASSPSFLNMERQSADSGFDLELCVAVVEGRTSLGRMYAGCCSSYLASIKPCDQEELRMWITPGSFHKLPLNQYTNHSPSGDFFQTPILCVGAGTGIAPLRSLIFEREAIRLSQIQQNDLKQSTMNQSLYHDNTLVFGCRKRSMDYYYEQEWESLTNTSQLRLIPAFSRDQIGKHYVQRALRELDQGSFIVHHILERSGAVYIAGGSKMASAVRDEIVTALGAVLKGGDSDAKKLLSKLKRQGLFAIEAWS